MPPFTPAEDAALDAVLVDGRDRLDQGDLVAAVHLFRRAVALAPDHGEGWATLGDLAATTPETARLLARAFILAPDEWRWRLATAEALLLDDPPRAVVAFTEALVVRGDSARARRGLARALARSGDGVQAIAEYRELVALGGADADDACDLAALLMADDRPEAAAEALSRHTRGGDPDPGALALMAEAWDALGEPLKARRALERALELGAVATPAVAALRQKLMETGDKPPPPTSAYVRALFDRYAQRFDHDLVDRLGYVAPSLLADAVARAAGDDGVPTPTDRAVDLGCGTGLAAVSFRTRCAELVGVDLSPAMVAEAERRGLYDRLVVGDLLGPLTPDAAWTLVIAADVFIYLGDLTRVFNATAAALAPGGMFAFTVEAMTDEELATGATLVLRASRRYAHDGGALARDLTKAGLSVMVMERAPLRWDRGAAIEGWVVVARRSWAGDA